MNEMRDSLEDDFYPSQDTVQRAGADSDIGARTTISVSSKLCNYRTAWPPLQQRPILEYQLRIVLTELYIISLNSWADLSLFHRRPKAKETTGISSEEISLLKK